MQDALAYHSVGSQRAKGIITYDAVPLVVVEVHGPEDSSKLRWGVPILARFKVDKQPLVAAFGQAFASTIVTVDFCSGTAQWYDQILECQKLAVPRRRKAKLNRLAPFMRKRAAILIQESRWGTRQADRRTSDLPAPVQHLFNPLSQKAGGTTSLAPANVRGQNDPRFRFQHQILATGRVALLTSTNDKGNFTIDLMDVPNFALDNRAQDQLRAKRRGLV
eukprot:4388693-Pyramimonas_sp.AAC.1